MVKGFKKFPRIFNGSRLRHATRKDARIWFNGKQFQTRRRAPSETNELRNCKRRRRAAVGREIFIGRNEDGKFRARGDFNPRHGQNGRNVERRRFNFLVRDGDNGAIVVVGNCSAVQPRVKRRTHFRERHREPDRQRQRRRRAVQARACATVELVPSVSQIVCNIVNTVPGASLILRISTNGPGF